MMKQIFRTVIYLLFVLIFTCLGLYFGFSTLWLAAIMLALIGMLDFAVLLIAVFTTYFSQRPESDCVENGGTARIILRISGPLKSFCAGYALCSRRCYKRRYPHPLLSCDLRGNGSLFSLAVHGIGGFYIGAPHFCIESPLGIFTLRSPKKLSMMGFPGSILITPRAHVLKPFLFYPMPMSSVDPRLMAAQSDPDQVAGVRLYERGDPLRSVNWKLTASRQELYVKQFESNSLEISASLYLDTAPEPLLLEALESAMSAGSALLDNRPIALSTWNGQKNAFPKGDRRGLARVLALIDCEAPATAYSPPLVRLKELQHEGQCAVVLCKLAESTFPYLYSLPRGSIVVLCGESASAALDLEKIREYGINLYLCAKAGELICPIID